VSLATGGVDARLATLDEGLAQSHPGHSILIPAIH